MKLFLIATTLALFFMSCHFDDSHDHNRHNHSITYTSNNGHFTVTPLFDPDGNPKVGVKIEIELPILDRNGDFIENATVNVKPWKSTVDIGTLDAPNVSPRAGFYRVTNIIYNTSGQWDLHIYIGHETVQDSFSIPITVE